MSESSISQQFGDDHDRLDTWFATFREYKHLDFPRAKEAFDKFKQGLQRHIIAEERVLFPLFERRTNMGDNGPTVVMRAEHCRIGNCLQTITAKIRRHDPGTDADETRLHQILQEHNRKEELVLYPALDALLTPQEKATAIGAMRAVAEQQCQCCREQELG